MTRARCPDPAELEGMTREELVRVWTLLFAAPVPPRISRPLMLRILSFELQARRHGGLSRAAQRKLAAMARSLPRQAVDPADRVADDPVPIAAGHMTAAGDRLRARPGRRNTVRAPRPLPGTRLIREWNGVSHIIEVADAGFIWNGTEHRSLSAIARAITGARWSGPRFFGLTGRAAT